MTKLLAWPVSARTAPGLAAQAGRLAAHLAARPELDPADIGFSLAARPAFEHRAVITGADLAELAAGLAAVADGRPGPGVVTGVAPSDRVRTGFVFAGQGSQRAGMAAGLRAASPVFAAAFDQACALLEAELGVPVAEAPAGQEDQTLYAQAGLFAVGAGLIALLKACGITPDAVAGHSVGEVTAAYAAGVLSLPDACRLVAARARLMQALPAGGAMTAIAATEAEVAAALRDLDGIAIAAVNGPDSVVISGDAQAVDRVADGFAARGCRVRRLHVSHAFHSPRMDPVLGQLGQVAASLAHATPRIPWAGALTGNLVTAPNPGYWVIQARQPVRFADAVATLAAQGITVFIEIGPDGTLSAIGPAALPDHDAAAFIPTLRPDVPAPAAVASALAKAHVHGAAVDWAAVLAGGRPVSLPTYAFQRQRFWPRLPEPRRDQDRPAAADWRYRVTWAPVPDPDPAVLSGTWLVVVPAGQASGDLADRCVGAMTARGARVIVTEPGAGTVPDEVRGVVSLLALDESPVPDHPVLPAGLAGTLALVQTSVQTPLQAPLWVLTRGAVATAEQEALASPRQAMAWGLGRVAALEHPGQWGGLVDLPPAWDERVAARLCAVLAGCGEDQVAIRPAGLLARRLARAPLPAAGAGRWVPRGTVLVTGGTGAIGGHVARWLAGRGAPHVVLASRSGPAAAGVAALAAGVAAAGAQVTVVCCDSAERSGLSALLTRISVTGPPLSAVLHAAGTGQATAVADTGVAELAAVTAAKTAGAALLDELTAGLDLDGFVLFSSIAATWGSGLQPAYAAGNAFLDALAEDRSAKGLKATSVAWGPWGGGGMTDADGAAHLQRRGLRLLDPRRAVQALGQVLDGGERLVTVADVDWDRFAPAFTVRRPSPLIAALPEAAQALAAAAGDPPAGSGTEPALRRRLVGLPPAEQRQVIVDLVLAEAAAVLGHASAGAIEADRAFKDLGFDSLTAVELRDRLNAATGLRLPATLIFDHPTPAAIGEYLWTEEFAGQEPGVPLLVELDKLESLLSQSTPDGATHELVAARLQGFLSKWSDVEVHATKQAVAQKIESASDDEIFDFINKELGRTSGAFRSSAGPQAPEKGGSGP